MRQLEMTVNMAPKGKPRHRNTKTGRTYPDPKGVKWEDEFAWHVRSEMRDGMWTADVALKVDVIAYFDRTADEAKQYKNGQHKHMKCELPCTVKPDLDNVLKIALDALNGVLFHDDKQVVVGSVVKCKCAIGDKPRVWFRVSELKVDGLTSEIAKLRGAR